MGAAAAAILAAPAAALTVEEFFALPPSLAGTLTGDVFYDDGLDELLATGFSVAPAVDFLAAIGSFSTPPGATSSFASDFEGALGASAFSGDFLAFDIAPDESYLRALFATTFDPDEVTGGNFALVINFDQGETLGDLFDFGVAFVSFSVYVTPEDSGGGGEVIPLPAPLALMGAGLLGLSLAARRRRA